MARPLRIQFPNALYHLTGRGNERKNIVADDTDRTMFFHILAQSVHTYNIILHAFVLMDNHWHLLAQTPLANLSEFMRHFNISYTSYFNRRHDRSGHLYQGRYHSILIQQETHLEMVSCYIHLNPVKTNLHRALNREEKITLLRKYRWSSLPGYLRKKHQLVFVEYKTVLNEYGKKMSIARQAYWDHLLSSLDKDNNLHQKVIGQSILGDDDFISALHQSHFTQLHNRELPGLKAIRQYLSQARVLDEIATVTGISNPLKETGTNRQIIMTALYNYAGLTNKEIGNLFGIDYSTVSRGRKLLLESLHDKSTRKLMKKIDLALSRIKI